MWMTMTGVWDDNWITTKMASREYSVNITHWQVSNVWHDKWLTTTIASIEHCIDDTCQQVTDICQICDRYVADMCQI